MQTGNLTSSVLEAQSQQTQTASEQTEFASKGAYSPTEEASEEYVQEASYYPYIREDGTFTEDFLKKGLPEDLQPYVKQFEMYKSLPALLKSHVNLAKKIGANKLTLPKEGDEAGWREFYKGKGCPDTPEQYNIQMPPEGIPYDEELAGFFKNAAHKVGLNQQEVNTMVSEWNRYIASKVASDTEREKRLKDEAMKELRTKWGKYADDELELANDAVRTFDPDGVLDALGLSNHPLVVQIFNRIGHAVSEDKLIHRPPVRRETRETATAKYKALMAHPAYLDARHPEHASIVEEVARYFQLAAGE